MNGLYFLIPFLLVASVGLVFDFDVLVYAQEPNEVIGKNYNDRLLSIDTNGIETHRFTTTPERISIDDEYWHDYYFQDVNGILRFESSIMSLQFSDLTSSFKIWSGGLIEQRSPDIPSISTTLKTAINGTDIWTTYPLIQSSYTFEDILYGKKISFSQNHNDVILKTIFNTSTDTGLKWTYEITNLSKENSKFGITTVCNDCGELSIDGVGYLDGTWTKSDLINSDGTYKSLSIKGFSFDPQDYEHDYLWAFENINGNIIFDFTYSKGTLEIGDTLIIDPSINPTTSDDDAIRENDNDNVCEDTGGSHVAHGSTTELFLVYMYPTSGSTDCLRGYMEFDISGLPSGITVSDSYLTVGVSTALTAGNTIEVYSMQTQPSTRTATQIFDEIDNGVLLSSANGDWLSTGDQVMDWGSVGDMEIQTLASASQSWFAIGTKMTDEVLTGSHEYVDISPSEESGTDPNLTVIYTINSLPDAITDLSAPVVGAVSANFTFSTPDLNGGNLTNYLFNFTIPFGNPQTFLANTTDAYLNVTGLLPGSNYSVRVSALTENGYNATGNILNFTTYPIQDAITDLAILFIDETNAFLSWTTPGNPGTGTVTGYQFNFSTPYGDPLSIAVNDTENLDTNIVIVSLTENTLYSFRGSAISEFGLNLTGANIVNGTTLNSTSYTNVTSGGLTFDAINPLQISPITYTRTNGNSNDSILIDVDYPPSYDLNCNVNLKFANTNSTYSNMTTTPVSSSEVRSQFNFTNPSGEVISLNCYDTITGENSVYVITNDDFVFLDLLDDLRGGQFGSFFDYGGIDFVTLIIIIFSMVGFNRKDPIVGVIINAIILGVAGFYGFIEIYTAMLGATVTATMFIIFSKRAKN